MGYRVLIVDDDTELAELLEQYLSTEGFNVTLLHDGLEAIEHLQHAQQKPEYDAIVLDFMLPGMQGLDILQRLRTFSSVPVLMLTARGDDIDRIVGLEAGADDYLPKPCNPRELLARLRAILRRTDKPATAASLHSESVIHGISIDASQRNCNINGQTLDLTSAEFNTLLALVNHAGTVVSKEQLTELALNRKHTRYDRSIDVHISSVRKKISAFIPDKELIKTVRGSGYIMVSEKDA
jgi:DNA-binding response OmpR family regulator